MRIMNSARAISHSSSKTEVLVSNRIILNVGNLAIFVVCCRFVVVLLCKETGVRFLNFVGFVLYMRSFGVEGWKVCGMRVYMGWKARHGCCVH
jgi:hypothetical protein